MVVKPNLQNETIQRNTHTHTHTNSGEIWESNPEPLRRLATFNLSRNSGLTLCFTSNYGYVLSLHCFHLGFHTCVSSSSLFYHGTYVYVLRLGVANKLNTISWRWVAISQFSDVLDWQMGVFFQRLLSFWGGQKPNTLGVLSLLGAKILKNKWRYRSVCSMAANKAVP